MDFLSKHTDKSLIWYTYFCGKVNDTYAMNSDDSASRQMNLHVIEFEARFLWGQWRTGPPATVSYFSPKIKQSLLEEEEADVPPNQIWFEKSTLCKTKHHADIVLHFCSVKPLCNPFSGILIL